MNGSKRLGLAGTVIAIGVIMASAVMVGPNTPVQASTDGICDRTEEVRTAILDKLADVSACADVTDTDLSGITGSMDLSDESISALKTGDFQDLTALETLKLNDNSISSLPTDVFDDLSSLETLWLYENQISSLSGNVFDGLSSLEELRLDHNQLSSLPAGLLDGLSDLRHLELAFNPGATFTFTAELKASGRTGVNVEVAQGIPFKTSVTLSADGGSLSAETVELSGGSTQSEMITVTPDQGQTEGVTVSVSSAEFQVTKTDSADSLEDLQGVISGQNYFWNGIQAGTGGNLTLENLPAEGTPSITGTAQVGKTLTASTLDIADADGLTKVSYSYQWLSSRDTEIVGATSSTYEPAVFR